MGQADAQQHRFLDWPPGNQFALDREEIGLGRRPSAQLEVERRTRLPVQENKDFDVVWVVCPECLDSRNRRRIADGQQSESSRLDLVGDCLADLADDGAAPEMRQDAVDDEVELIGLLLNCQKFLLLAPEE